MHLAPNRRRLSSALLALLCAPVALNAADWYLQANHGLADNWNTTSAWWSQPSGGGANPASINPADTYHTNGYSLRTPEVNVPSDFPGILVLDGGSIFVKQKDTDVVSISALLSGGGTSRTISNVAGAIRVLEIGEMRTARGETTEFSTGGATRGLDIAVGDLSGDGDIRVSGGGTVDLEVAAGGGFFGTIYVTGSTTLTITGATAIKGALIVETGSDVVLNASLSVGAASVGGAVNGTDGVWGLKKSAAPLAAATTHTAAALQAAHPTFFTGGSADLVVGRPSLVVNAGNVIDNVGLGQLGLNLSAGKFWESASPNYQQDLKTLKVGMIRTSIYPDKGFSLLDMDVRVAQIINAGGTPLFVGAITKPAPPFNTEQQHLHDNFLALDGTIGSGTAATNVAYLVNRYKNPPFNLTTQYWEVGNEPDISIDYQVASPQEYVDIYQGVHSQLVASGLRENVVLCGPVTAFEYGFAANANRSDTIMRAFLEQTGAPLDGHRQVDVVTRHLYAEIYDWETNAPDPVENAYNLLNHPTEQVSFTQAHVSPWTYRGEAAIQSLLRQHGHPADVGTGITEFNVPLQFRHTITQGLWWLTYDHFGLYNPANVIGSGFAFDIKTNPAMHYYSNGLPNHAWWATYVHNRLTGDDILEQHSSDSHLLVTATQDERHVYVQVLNRDETDITATLDIAGAPVAAATDAEMFVMSATELPDVAVPTTLGTSFSYTFPAMTTRVFRYLRDDAPPVVPPPGAPTANVVIDTDFTTAPTGMTTYQTGSFTPGIVGGDLKLINNQTNLTTAVVFNGQPLAGSQKRMRAEFIYRMTNGHYGSGFVFAAYSADPGNHGGGLGGLGFYQQPNALFGVKRKVKDAKPEVIEIVAPPVTPMVDAYASHPLANYPVGYNTPMFVVVDYDGDAGFIRVRLHEGSDDTGNLVADIVNRVGVPASLPAGTVFGFTSSTASTSQINWIDELKITTDNGAVPPPAPDDIVLDNTSPGGVVASSGWVASTGSAGYEGVNYLHDNNAGKGAKTVTYTPTVLTAGNYEVFAKWTSHANRSAAVPITIAHDGGTATAYANQQANGGSWQSLGTHAFAAGSTGTVTISNAGTTGYVVADAVKLVWRP